MNFDILKDFILCIPATVFFAILLKTPCRAIFVSSVLGGAGYAIYELASPAMNSQIAGYFIGTFVMAALSEVLARVMKMPVTVFIIPAIIPLVPGFGLYNTMLYLVQGKDSMAGQTGAATILEIVAMAIALVITSALSRSIFSIAKALKKQRASGYIIK